MLAAEIRVPPVGAAEMRCPLNGVVSVEGDVFVELVATVPKLSVLPLPTGLNSVMNVLDATVPGMAARLCK
jgi:hypothetical protein